MLIKKYEQKSVLYLNNNASMSSVIRIKESNVYAHSHKESCNTRGLILVYRSHDVLENRKQPDCYFEQSQNFFSKGSSTS